MCDFCSYSLIDKRYTLIFEGKKEFIERKFYTSVYK